jgi:B9 domain-containing protein 1
MMASSSQPSMIPADSSSKLLQSTSIRFLGSSSRELRSKGANGEIGNNIDNDALPSLQSKSESQQLTTKSNLPSIGHHPPSSQIQLKTNRQPTLDPNTTTESSQTSSFFVMITGHIESAKSSTSSLTDQLYCRYSFLYGPDWEIVHGVSMGMTQIGRQGVLGSNNEDWGNEIVWNFPIDISFQSTNPHGWPRLVVSIYGFDFMGRDVVRGYASLLLPVSPGRYTKYLKTYRPVSGSWFIQAVNWLLGTNPEYYDSKMVARGGGRAVTRVVSSDRTVKVHLTVTVKDFATFGFT